MGLTPSEGAGEVGGDRRRPLVLIPTGFGSLLFERRTARYFPFDAPATRALELLRRHPPQALDLAWRGLVETLERRGLLTPDGHLPAERLPLTPPATGLAGPLALHLELTRRCDLRCAHCFAAAGPRDTPQAGEDAELSLAELDALFAELATLGSYRLGLTGGEPTLRADLLPIIDAALARGLAPCLTTNGQSLDAKLAGELGARPLLWLNLSFDGARAETHDRLRGHGSFARARAAAAELAGRARFSLAFTIWSGNVDEVEACVALAQTLGAEAAVFRPLYPVGRAVDGALQPSFTAYQGALDRLTALAGDSVADAAGAPGQAVVELCAGAEAFAPSTREVARAALAGSGCGAARLVASISASGRVSPCSFLGASFEAGSLREQSFAQLWQAGASFQRLRVPSTPGGFAGGCRARALAFAGDADAADPWLVRDARHPSSTDALELGS